MPTDKDLVIRLLNAVEDLYLENTLLRVVYRQRGWHSMDKVLAEMKADPEATALVRSKFAQLRLRIQQDTHLSDVIQEFLRVVPATKDVN
jgi:hypothetical protein